MACGNGTVNWGLDLPSLQRSLHWATLVSVRVKSEPSFNINPRTLLRTRGRKLRSVKEKVVWGPRWPPEVSVDFQLG